MKTRIITDSASDILEGEYENLTVLPLSITFGTATYLDGVDLTHERFYELLVEEDELPKTGQVNPYAFGQVLDEVHAAGQQAVVITLSSKLSGTHQSAITAAAQAKGVVRVVDSLNVCVGERVLVECALRLAEKGLGAVEIADQICAAAQVRGRQPRPLGGGLSRRQPARPHRGRHHRHPRGPRRHCPGVLPQGLRAAGIAYIVTTPRPSRLHFRR